ncbi:mCG128256, isoform CRA_a, partial [Mus musculus]
PCPGCPRDIPVDSPELKEVLGHSIAQLNTENDHPFYFKIDTVKKATSQQSLDCNANVYMRPWENKVIPTVKCQALDKTIPIRRRPPGFSPFRSAKVQETKAGTTRLLRACEYKGRLSKAGAEPAPERQAESSQVKQ